MKPLFIVLIILCVLLILFLFYLLLILPGKRRKEKWEPFFQYHYAHRGLFDNNSNAPENSLAAFQKAIESGFGIEFDVQLTKDDVLVVFHDATLKRMCGVDGNVWDYTYEELQTFTLSSSDQRIPKLEEVLKLVKGQVPLIIEYKLDRVQTKVCELANNLLKDYKGLYCIECFHPAAPNWYKKNRPDIIRGQLCEEYYKEEQYRTLKYFIASFLVTNIYTKPDFIAYNCLHRKNISRCLCRKVGAVSVAWTVKSVAQYEEIKKDFDLFIFDSCILPKDK